MRYLVQRALLPDSESTIRRLEDAAQSLAGKLRNLPVKDLQISEYNQRYFGDYVANIDSVIQRYAFILAWALAPSDTLGWRQSLLLDYGGGSGMMSMLARAAGVPRVIYNDIYEGSCRDARVIAKCVGLEADEYVHGEIDAVLSLLRGRGLEVDVVANNDVIEHIYDIEAFLRRLPDLTRGRLTVSLATAANTHNPMVRRVLERGQRQREFQGQAKVWGHKEIDSVRSYLEIRADIVRARAPELAAADVQRLADATRGMNKRDVEAAVDDYKTDRRLPPMLSHPTNTCDPMTGSWDEHLMDTNRLRNVMASAGFETRILRGPHGWRRHPAKRMAARIVDLAISRLGDQGLLLAPYFVVYGTREALPSSTVAEPAS